MKKLFLLLAISSFAFIGCYYDKVDELNPGVGLFTTCDTSHPVSYHTHIVPILTNYCYGCHQGANPSSNFRLDDYASLYSHVPNGQLSNDINGGIHGGHIMPPTFMLDSCYYNQLNYWIDSLGAPNN